MPTASHPAETAHAVGGVRGGTRIFFAPSVVNAMARAFSASEEPILVTDTMSRFSAFVANPFAFSPGLPLPTPPALLPPDHSANTCRARNVTPYSDTAMVRVATHKESTKLASAFVTNFSACPELPPLSSVNPPSPSPTPAQFIAYSLHRTRLQSYVTFAALFLLSRPKDCFPAAHDDAPIIIASSLSMSPHSAAGSVVSLVAAAGLATPPVDSMDSMPRTAHHRSSPSDNKLAYPLPEASPMMRLPGLCGRYA
ncbi:hypothetical protein BOTBODRAFT_179658 [Botryobasidium botryosum FD-172 SS1]|uniref:Uncharacterized protein n=1 Tax=Botryobasidium botryosum (strain FD-172 SS1) TaxID=930990 RepID=A0A067LZM9_BOTB1|nr:hypothetical protein BOTBODRAFT_179658 [Botryobasidium botryosum FD-172 SS1]